MTNYKRVLIIPVWSAFLMLPFMGMIKSAMGGGIILAGFLLFSLINNYVQSEGGRRASSGIQMRKDRIHSVFNKPHIKKGVIVLVLLLLIVLPFFMNNYYVDVLTIAGIYTLLALGLNIVVGLAGLLDLGYIAFYAVGAYSYGILNTEFGIAFWPALLIGAVLAALFGTMLGVITLRLRGDYLAIVTLGFLMIVHLVLNNWDGLTNGPNGILGIESPSIGGFTLTSPMHYYFLILILAGVAVFVIHRINNSRTGRAWIAMREDEIAASAMGINVTYMKILAFALGASLAGVAGVFFAGRYAFISPESFTFFETVLVLSMVVLGGMGSIIGVIIGVALLIILPEIFRGFNDYRMLVFGGAMVFMMIFRPQGLIGNPRRKIELMPIKERI
ncbi:MAG: branched-chain amino acid ABC transporter permease [Nitrospirae bacterium]|nr:branched-chain amino acid ABC transporter permease [Nitrospirota bacterium]